VRVRPVGFLAQASTVEVMSEIPVTTTHAERVRVLLELPLELLLDKLSAPPAAVVVVRVLSA